MLYLNNANILYLGIDWSNLVTRIADTARLIYEQDFSQPVKPYLRYNDPRNRIIAMPAYVGGKHQSAGIKWIASFPDNIKKGIPRAHAVIILNEVNTGKPLCTLNSAIVSSIRTAAVTGALIREYFEAGKSGENLTVSINGFGPIGQMHLQMMEALYGNAIARYLIYDLDPKKAENISAAMKHKVVFSDSWQTMYTQSHIFVTCTVSTERYINIPPPKGSLQLNVSLRDYVPAYKDYVDMMIVDDWEEVCRENTDIEVMYKQADLKKSDTVSLSDLIYNKRFKESAADDVIMFNPMGMAVFDITVATYFYDLAISAKVGSLLED